MKATSSLAVLSGLLTGVLATWGGSINIPWEQEVVALSVQDFQPAFNYKSPEFSSPHGQIFPASVTANKSYWLQDIKRQGIAAFNPNKTYEVFRNVKHFGAVGDGVHDDTTAINLAISSGGRCEPGACASTTISPAVVYFPAGTYRITSSIIDYYYTQIIGNPNSLPVLKADPNFIGFGLIDADRYGASGLGFGSTNTFYRQVRNFIFDLTAIAPSNAATGIHWPTAQATSIQNCIFKMSEAPGSLHRGIYMEEGSGGFLNDLWFYGGANGAVFGNQQFTMRNLNIYNAQVSAIQQLWDWGWTYKNINIHNCTVGLDITATTIDQLKVGSITFIDSSITDTKVGIATNTSSTSQNTTAGSLIVENVCLSNVGIAIQGSNSSTLLAGIKGQSTIKAWGRGHGYTPNGPVVFQGLISPFPRPGSLLSDGSKFYERSKPQYENDPLSKFVSVRSGGAKGNGKTDDTAALNKIFAQAAKDGKIVFVDAGDYLVTSSLTIPPGSKIVGESYPVILGSGKYFSDVKHPKPVVRVGKPGDSGVVEWSDMIVSTQGAAAGAILIEWNLASPYNTPSGMWDVHTRIGGFAGSKLQLADCPKTPTGTNLVKKDCIAAFMSMHVTSKATGLYLENVWFWTADHDIEDPNLTQITILTGRGLYIESELGNIWLVGTAVEHHALYQYQFSSTTNIFAGQIQTETAYYQPNQPAKLLFLPQARWNDPDFATYCKGKSGNCGGGWGLRVLNSQDLLFYGAGLYSFFDNYSTACSDKGSGETCQTQIFGIDTGVATVNSHANSDVYVYNLNTIGSASMIDRSGKSVAKFSDNTNAFPDTIALFRTG